MTVTADILLPILLYVTAQARQSQLQSQMNMLSCVLQNDMLNSHSGYLLATL